MGGALILGFSVDWWRTVGVKALGELERKKEEVGRRLLPKALFLDAERHREESSRRDVAMV